MARRKCRPVIQTQRARELRARQTPAESLLWSVLRGRRLCGLKFRRQYAVGPFLPDFACVERRLTIELDGGYHDLIFERDRARQEFIEGENWSMLRFANQDVLEDVEAVAIAICRHLGLKPGFDTSTYGRAPSP